MSFQISQEELQASANPYELLVKKSNLKEASLEISKSYKASEYSISAFDGDFINLKKDVLHSLQVETLLDIKHMSASTNELYKSLPLTKNYLADTSNVFPSDLSQLKNATYLNKFLSSFSSFNFGKSRIAIQNSSDNLTNHLHSHQWHCDSSIFFNLRINVPIISCADYVIQIATPTNDDKNLNIFNIPLIEEKCIAYDTELAHRPFSMNKNNQPRINLIITIFPWLEFKSNTRCFYPNEYFGKIHPFKMLEEGMISSFIKKV